jgi:hypothetical protein
MSDQIRLDYGSGTVQSDRQLSSSLATVLRVVPCRSAVSSGTASVEENERNGRAEEDQG